MPAPNIKLNNGVAIPQLGFGVFKISPAETADAVQRALDIGYRHFDTAQMYGNEKEVGQGIAKSGIHRNEVFVTSKLNNNRQTFDDALRAFDETMERLDMETIDLFLIHWPLPTVRDYVKTWNTLEQIYSDGRARSIGVSNFQPSHLDRPAKESSVVPAVNQIEVHPFLTQEALLAYNAQHGIATEAWSPIARGGELLQDATIAELATQYGKTPAQIVLRWHLQLKNIVFPKSSNPQRMKENFEIFDFELSDSDVQKVSSLNRNKRTGPDPDTFDHVPPR